MPEAPTLYHADPVTGELRGISTARRNPRWPDEYLQPAFSTTVPAPEAGEHEAAVWSSAAESWSVVPDFRRAEAFSTETGEPVTVSELGPLPDGVTLDPRPTSSHVWDGETWVLDLARQRAQLRAALGRHRRGVETGGVTVNGCSVYTDRESQAMISGTALAAQQNAAMTVKWKCADGTFMELDAAAIVAMASGVAAHIQACFTEEARIAALIDNDTLTSEAEIEAEWSYAP